MSFLILGAREESLLSNLREIASKHPVLIDVLVKEISQPAVKKKHMRQMARQTIVIPVHYSVTYSIELGHPIGACRHMSMSSGAAGRVPTPQAVNMVAEKLGFVGGAEMCTVWMEDLERPEGKQQAVNLVQPI